MDGTNELAALRREFLESKGVRRESGNYRANLESALEAWFEWLDGRGIESFDGIDDRTMARYARRLRRRVNGADGDAIAAASAWTYYNNVSAFLTYAVRWGHLPENPALKAVATEEMPDRPSRTSGDQQFWTPDERKAITRHVDERAIDAVESDGRDAIEELRDRALVYTVAYTGVRGGEILRDGGDSRRNGLSWADVDLENSRLRVLGKSQRIEEVGVPEQVHAPLEAYRRAVDPPSPEWPVFVTLHRPTLYQSARSGLSERMASDEIEELLEERSPLSILREYDVRPPALTTRGARGLVARLGDEAGATDGDDSLTLHGARRGVGEAIYRERGAAAAQRALRHADPRTTSEMYSHIEASELAAETTAVFDDE